MWHRVLDLMWRHPWVRSALAAPLSVIVVDVVAMHIAAASGCESRGEWGCLGAALIALAVAIPVTVVVWWGCLRALRVPRAGLITVLTTCSVVGLTWLNIRLHLIPLSLISGIAFWAAVSAGAWTAVLTALPRSSEPT